MQPLVHSWLMNINAGFSLIEWVSVLCFFCALGNVTQALYMPESCLCSAIDAAFVMYDFM